MAFNVWGGAEPRVRDGVRGEALSMKSAASPEVTETSSGGEQSRSTTGTYRAWTCEARFVVRAPGQQPVYVSSRRQMTREKYLIPGLRLPVTVSESNPTRFRIEWEEVPTIDELIARGDPLFTNPDATRPLLQEAWRAAGVPVPPAAERQEIDGPNARVISFGGSAQTPGFLTNRRKLDVLLSVAIPGQGRFGYRWLGKGPRDRILRPGMNINVSYDPARPREVDIPWDEVGFTTGDLKQMGLAIRDALRSGRAASRSAPAMRYQSTLQRVMANGVEMPATIRSFTPGPHVPATNGKTVHLEMEVEPPGGATYGASFDQPLPDTIVSTLAAGQRVTVKVVKDDPQALMLWNTPYAAGGADPDTGRPTADRPAATTGVPAGDERIASLEKLQQLRASGGLSEEEFQALKAKILASWP